MLGYKVRIISSFKGGGDKKFSRILVILMVSGCATVTQDLAQTLKYADGRSVGVRNIDFKALQITQASHSKKPARPSD